MIITLKPYKYNQCVTYRVIGEQDIDDSPSYCLLYPNDEATFFKATWYLDGEVCVYG